MFQYVLSPSMSGQREGLLVFSALGPQSQGLTTPYKILPMRQPYLLPLLPPCWCVSPLTSLHWNMLFPLLTHACTSSHRAFAHAASAACQALFPRHSSHILFHSLIFNFLRGISLTPHVTHVYPFFPAPGQPHLDIGAILGLTAASPVRGPRLR